MKKDIDDILVSYFGEEELTREEWHALEEWCDASDSHVKVHRLIERLRKQRKPLSAHLSWQAAYHEMFHRVMLRRRKRRLAFGLASAAAAIALLFGFWLVYALGDRQQPVPVAQQVLKVPANTRAELTFPNGEKRTWNIREEIVITSDTTGGMHTDDHTLIVASNDAVEKAPQYYTLSIPYGAEYNLQLPDGTKIFLNSGTTLRYPDRFAGDKREVFLSGEAYFDVVTDSLHPFVVRMEEMDVRVLGTAFNINAYPDEEWIKTTLERGTVEACCDAEVIAMQPGHQVAFHKTTRAADYFSVVTTRHTSWKDGYYDFEDLALGELMRVFTRWYDVKVFFASQELSEIKFSGRLKRYEDVKPLFEMLEYTQDVKFNYNNGTVIIQPK